MLDVSPAVPAAGKPSGSLADPLLQFDQSGNVQFRYFAGPTPTGDNTVYIEEQIGTQGQAGTEYFPLGDNENTPHEVVNTSSAVVDHIIANTFGLEASESNTSIHHWAGFEGGHFDPDTALTNDDHRWYDPVVGRWLSEDPIGFNGGDANVLCYVGNNPVSHSDLLGEAAVLGVGPQTQISMLYGSFDGHDIYTPVNLGSASAHSSGTPINLGHQWVQLAGVVKRVQYMGPTGHPTGFMVFGPGYHGLLGPQPPRPYLPNQPHQRPRVQAPGNVNTSEARWKAYEKGRFNPDANFNDNFNDEILQQKYKVLDPNKGHHPKKGHRRLDSP